MSFNDFVASEQLSVSDLVKNRHLSKCMSDVGRRQYIQKVEYLGKIDKRVVIVSPP